jgi:glycerol-3-phosphate dehydrogenase (NAD(P)+)
MVKKIGVVGAGAWGTALAMHLCDKGHEVALWMYERDLAEETARTRENRVYLPGFRLADPIEISSELGPVVSGSSVVLSVVPSHTVRGLATQLAPFLSDDALIVSASKGIELDTLMPLSEVFRDVLPKKHHRNLCFLSGPSFALEVARKMPTAVAVACCDPVAGRKAQEIFSSPSFRVYTNPDVLGTELAGALKNVVAIAAGALEGMGCGHNTMAALLTRGLAEMTRLGVAMGAVPQTFYGLAGMGDLVLTCTGGLSRNRTLGTRLGRGEKLKDILAGMKAVAEGVKTARAARDLAVKFDVEMPIVDEVYRLLYEDKAPARALSDLMTRELKGE